MRIFNRTKPPIKMLGELRSYSRKLKNIIINLRKRDTLLFNVCTQTLEEGEHERAKIYANELANVRTMLNSVVQSELAIDWIVMRVENIIEYHDLLVNLNPTIRTIRSITDSVAKEMPEMTHIIEQLNTLINDALSTTRLNSPQLPLTKKSVESEEIIREASEYIEQKLEMALPEPPFFALRKEQIKSKRKAVPIAV